MTPKLHPEDSETTSLEFLVSGRHVAILTLYLAVVLMDGESLCSLLKLEVEDTSLHLL